jgi:hypothetical protein
MDEAERCNRVGYIYLSRLIAFGEPADLKSLPDVTPPGTRRVEVFCEPVTRGLQLVRSLEGVRDATIFGQSIHLLVDESLTDERIHSHVASDGVGEVTVLPLSPSLEDVFVTLTASQARGKEAA